MLGASAPVAASTGANPNTRSADDSHFAADYILLTQNGLAVEWKCAGERIDNHGQGLRDVEECSLSGPGTAEYVPGDYRGNPLGPSPGFDPANLTFMWFSDFDGRMANMVHVKINGASSRAHVDATF